eukprot:g22534.t1
MMFTAAISAVQERWALGIRLLGRIAAQRLAENIIAVNAAAATLEYNHKWCLALYLCEAASMLGSPLESPGYDAILAACSRGRAWQAVLQLSGAMSKAEVRFGHMACGARFEALKAGLAALEQMGHKVQEGAGHGRIVQLKCDELRFSQSSISSRFHNGESLRVKIAQLVAGEALGPWFCLTVVRYGEHLLCMSNRRLYCLQSYQRLSPQWDGLLATCGERITKIIEVLLHLCGSSSAFFDVMSSQPSAPVGVAPAATAFVAPHVAAARLPHSHRPSRGAEAPSSSAAAGALPMFLLGTAGVAACRRAARGSAVASRAMPRKPGNTRALRAVTTLQAEAQPQRVAMQATAVAEAPTKTYEIGQKLHGWTCVRAEHIKEYSCTGYVFQHDQTGAELLSMVQPADENKTFSVVFRTPPENSNGIAHVLEHSVLCGSRKYPLKEPFVELMKSSLQTFLNAMTFPDRTCYPVASCNLKDFYNLIDVYMDAVFFPRAIDDPRVLAQEGWHYEIEKKDQDEPLKYKGVVFNEMKGVYSNPDAAHGRTANQSMFPDNQYGVDSGGDPTEIPNLTFEYFKDFHSKYYHPSNAKFWFYGDDPPDARLELVDKYLSEFSKIEVDSKIDVQPLWKEPRRVVEEFAVGEDEDTSKKTMVSVNWVISEGKDDLETSLALQFLNYLMMGTPASPLYKALIDSGMGSSVIGGGMDDGMLQTTFSALRFEEPLADLKARLEKGEPVFQDLIRTKILENSHKVIVESKPSKEVGKKMEEDEKAALEKHRKTLSEEDIEALIIETVKLKEIQEQTVNRRSLKFEETPKIPTEMKGSEPVVLRHALPTSGVIYMDVAFDLSRVPQELLPLVPLFTRGLTQLGTAKGDFVDLTRRVGMGTGGIAASTICMNKKGDPEPQYKSLSDIVERIEKGGWDGVLQQLKALQACIFNQASCKILNITSDSEHLDAAQGSLERLAEHLPKDEASPAVLLDPSLGRRADGIVVPTQVNYVGKGGNLYENGYDYHGSSLVVSKLLGATYLWDKVRVSGGAYGGFCRFDPRSGDFKYLSYRDPNLGQTLDTYDGAPAFLKDLQIGEDELVKAVIGCMGDVDAYQLPDAKGYSAMLRYLLEEDDEYRQKVRDQILGTTDFHKFGEALEPVVEKGGICVVGSADACGEAKEKYGLTLTSPRLAREDWWWKARLGKAYYQLGLLRDAEKQFKSALKDEEMISTHLELCKLALRFYRRMLQNGVTSAELWNNMGLCCFYAGQYDLTLSCFERALMLADDDNMADVWYNIGQVAIGVGDLGLAYQAFKIAISVDPNHAESYNNIGVLELRKGNVEQAQAQFGTAMRLAPHLFEPAFNGGLLAFKLGEFQDSFELANKALEAYPEHIESKELIKQLKAHFSSL